MLNESTSQSALLASPYLHLTFDIDWAPDHSIEYCLELLESYNTKATFFVTHYTPTLALIRDRGHSLGLHPNFLPNSSHGTNVTDIISHLLNIVPDAISLRTHALFQSSYLFLDLFSHFSQLRYDFSLYTPGLPSKLLPWYFNTTSFHRINFQWEDDFIFSLSKPHFIAPSIDSSLSPQIFNFHPLNISLNTDRMATYAKLKSYAMKNNIPFQALSSQDIHFHKVAAFGTCDYLLQLLNTYNFLSFDDLLCVLQ